MKNLMSLEMKNHAFWYNHAPHFFYGGEIHYFRLPPEKWATHLDQLRDLGLTTVSTYVPWLWHEPHAGQFDFRGETHPQRNLLKFLSLAQTRGLHVFLRVGPYVMAELRQEGLPEWLFTQYPDIIAKDPQGDVHPARIISYLHPTYLKLVERWYSNLASAVSSYFCTNQGPIFLTQLDNEVGMLHWVTALGDSSFHIQEAYQTFLSQRNQPRSYWTYSLFWREYRAQYLQHLADLAHSLTFPSPYVINVHGFRDFSIYSRGVDYPVGLSQLAFAKVLPTSLLGGDFYPGHVTYDNFHDIALAVLFTRAVNSPDTAAFSPEFQSGRFQDRPHIEPSDLDLAARVAIAYGLNGLNWYMLSSGENPENIGVFGQAHDWQAPLALDGSPRPQAESIRHLGQLLKDFAPSLVQSEPLPDITVGFYSPYYMTENSVSDTGEKPPSMVDTIVREREALHFDGTYRCLVAAGVNLDALWLDDPDSDALDIDSHPWLWVATTRFMDANTQKRLASYALAGGTLIIGPYVPDQDLLGETCHILADALGISLPLGPSYSGVVQILPHDSLFSPTCVSYSPSPDVEVMAYVKTENGDPAPVILTQPTRKGKVIVIGVALLGTYDTTYPLVKRLLKSWGKDIGLDNQNPKVHVARRLGPQGHFLFVHNFHETPEKTCITLHDQEKGVMTWTLQLEGRQALMLPYGDVPLIPQHLDIVQTTAELSLNEETIVIYRTKAEGFVKLKQLCDRSPECKPGDKGIRVEIADRSITIQWPATDHPTPIHIPCTWPHDSSSSHHTSTEVLPIKDKY